MHKEKYSKLKKIIQKANPDIMKLKFGCRIVTNQYKQFGIATLIKEDKIAGDNGDWNVLISGCIMYQNEKDFKVIGRPIRLTDIFLALEKNSIYNVCYSISGQGDNYSTNIPWKIEDDDLDHQSDKTKRILYNLLVNK